MCFQVAVKNSIDIFYFACIAPLHIFFSEEGKPVFFNFSIDTIGNTIVYINIQERWRRRPS